MKLYINQIAILERRLQSVKSLHEQGECDDFTTVGKISDVINRVENDVPTRLIVETIKKYEINEDITQMVYTSILENAITGTNVYIIDNDVNLNREERIVNLVRYLALSDNIGSDWVSVCRILEGLPSDIFYNFNYVHLLTSVEDVHLAHANLNKLVAAYINKHDSVDKLLPVFGNSLVEYIPGEELKDFILNRGIWFVNSLPYNELIMYYNKVINIVREKAPDDIRPITDKIVGVLHEHLVYHCNSITQFDKQLFEAFSYIKVLDTVLACKLRDKIKSKLDMIDINLSTIYDYSGQNTNEEVVNEIISDIHSSKYSHLSVTLLNELATKSMETILMFIENRDKDLIDSLPNICVSGQFVQSLIVILSSNMTCSRSRLLNHILVERDLLINEFIKTYKSPFLKDLNKLGARGNTITTTQVTTLLSNTIYGLDIKQFNMNVSDSQLLELLRNNDINTIMTLCARYAKEALFLVLGEDELLCKIFELCTPSTLLDLNITLKAKDVKPITQKKNVLKSSTFYTKLRYIQEGIDGDEVVSPLRDILGVELYDLLNR